MLEARIDRSVIAGSLMAAVALTASMGGGIATAQHASSPQRPSSIDILPVHGQVYLLAGPGSNAVVQVGSQGVLVVDTMREQDGDELLQAIRTVAGSRPIRYILNTHAHLDHTGSNQKIAEAGSQLVAGNFLRDLGEKSDKSAFIVAHENVLKAMSAPTGLRAPRPFETWPTDTFFQDEKDLYFNGEGIQLLHHTGHTDGDALVYFRGSDVIATGDLFSTVSYPVIDLANGGHINGVIEALNRLIDLAISEQFTEGGTRVIPGHGRICDELELVEYRDMVTIIRDRILAMIKKGMSLEEIVAARPTLGYESRYGATEGAWTTSMFIEAVYRNLASSPTGGR